MRILSIHPHRASTASLTVALSQVLLALACRTAPEPALSPETQSASQVAPPPVAPTSADRSSASETQPASATPGQDAAARSVAKPTEERLPPEVEIVDEDYAESRTRFHTRLVREEPAPQPWDPLVPPAGVEEVQYVSGELHLRAWLDRPPDDGRRHPAILYLHGGFAFGSEDWELTRPYRDAGFVVLAPLLRGENGQPGAFSFFYDEVDDALAAAEFLRSQPCVNPERLFLCGASAGGTIALLAAMVSPHFRAAASFSASPDQVLLCKYAVHSARDVPFDVTDREELTMRSPLAFAASFKCPVRIFYGTQDHFVLASQATAEVARQHGLDVEALAIEGDHSSSVPPAILSSLAFFEQE